MKKMIVTTMAAGLVAAVASADVGVTMDFASAYVFRGVTLNDGPVVQPGIEASGFEVPEEYGSVAFGAWGNYDINDYASGAVAGSSFQETDWYVSYGLPTIVSNLDLSVGYCEYSYGTGSADHEVSVGAGYAIGDLSLGATFYQGVGGLIHQQRYYELTASYAVDVSSVSEDLSASLDATAGFIDPSIHGADSGFHDYTLGGSLSYALTDAWSAGVSGTYIGQGDDKVLPEGDLGYDTEFVGMFSLACDM